MGFNGIPPGKDTPHARELQDTQNTKEDEWPGGALYHYPVSENQHR